MAVLLYFLGKNDNRFNCSSNFGNIFLKYEQILIQETIVVWPGSSGRRHDDHPTSFSCFRFVYISKNSIFIYFKICLKFPKNILISKNVHFFNFVIVFQKMFCIYNKYFIISKNVLVFNFLFHFLTFLSFPNNVFLSKSIFFKKSIVWHFCKNK